MKIMRRLAALILAFAGGAHAQAPQVPEMPAVPAQELMGYAAADFRQHMRPLPSEFRRVHLGELKSTDGSPSRWVLCGEFRQPGAKAPWTPFATIKTDPYEHWLGGSSVGFCKAPQFKAKGGSDLSPVLKARVAAE